jgi:hypothetical protein
VWPDFVNAVVFKQSIHCLLFIRRLCAISSSWRPLTKVYPVKRFIIVSCNLSAVGRSQRVAMFGSRRRFGGQTLACIASLHSPFRTSDQKKIIKPKALGKCRTLKLSRPYVATLKRFWEYLWAFVSNTISNVLWRDMYLRSTGCWRSNPSLFSAI